MMNSPGACTARHTNTPTRQEAFQYSKKDKSQISFESVLIYSLHTRYLIPVRLIFRFFIKQCSTEIDLLGNGEAQESRA